MPSSNLFLSPVIADSLYRVEDTTKQQEVFIKAIVKTRDLWANYYVKCVNMDGRLQIRIIKDYMTYTFPLKLKQMYFHKLTEYLMINLDL